MKNIQRLLLTGILFCLPLTASAAPSSRPADIEANKTSTSLNISWSAITDATKYETCFKSRTGEYASSTTLGTNKSFNNLDSSTSYYVKVRACDDTAVLSGSDCATEVTGCSNFTSAKRYATLANVDLEEVRGGYAKLNTGYQNKLTKYKNYIDKLTLLADDTIADFKTSADESIQALKTALDSMNDNTDAGAIQVARQNLRSADILAGFQYKLKVYRKLNGYYKKLDSFKEKITTENNYKTEFDTIINDAKDYFLAYEDTVKALGINNVDLIKNKYNELRNDHKYKFIGLVYKEVKYLDRVIERLEKYRSYVNDLVDNGSLLDETKTAYSTIIDRAISTYEGYVNDSEWSNINKYGSIKEKYSAMRKNSEYKKAATIARGLKRINATLSKINKYNTEINTYYNNINSNSDVNSTLKAVIGSINTKSTEHHAAIVNKFQIAADSFEKKILIATDPYSVYKNEIRKYTGYKAYGYFYKGYKAVRSLVIDKINAVSLVIETLGCDSATDELETAKTHADNTKTNLLSYALDNISEIKSTHYPSLKVNYRLANDAYKETLKEARVCLNSN